MLISTLLVPLFFGASSSIVVLDGGLFSGTPMTWASFDHPSEIEVLTLDQNVKTVGWFHFKNHVLSTPFSPVPDNTYKLQYRWLMWGTPKVVSLQPPSFTEKFSDFLEGNGNYFLTETNNWQILLTPNIGRVTVGGQGLFAFTSPTVCQGYDPIQNPVSGGFGSFSVYDVPEPSSGLIMASFYALAFAYKKRGN
jgi:hypothetical protein